MPSETALNRDWNLVDSCAWIEYFMDSPLAAPYAAPICDLDNLVVPTICMMEVYKFLQRNCGIHKARRAVGVMREGLVLPMDEDIALLAADLSIAEKLAAVDAIIYATARYHGATLWTQDEHFSGKPGVKFFKKP